MTSGKRCLSFACVTPKRERDDCSHNIGGICFALSPGYVPYRCIARVGRPRKTDQKVLVTFKAVPGGYNLADSRWGSNAGIAKEMIARCGKRWGCPVETKAGR